MFVRALSANCQSPSLRSWPLNWIKANHFTKE
jgi:hypothetical protein